MRKIFFDSSVYAKAFTQEPGTETINLLFQLAFDKRIQILLSVWAINETLGAIDKKHRIGEITELQKRTIIATIFDYAIKWSEEKEEGVAEEEEEVSDDDDGDESEEDGGGDDGGDDGDDGGDGGGESEE